MTCRGSSDCLLASHTPLLGNHELMPQEPNWQLLSTLNDGDLQMSHLNWIDEIMDQDDWSGRDGLRTDQLEEFAVVRSYVGLPGADELSDLTDKYWDAQRSDRYTDPFNDCFRRSVVKRAGGN
jgi:hypothetical protein